MSTLRVSAINNAAAPSGGLTISAAGLVSGGGMDLIVSQSFTAQAAVSINSCFTATYDNYRVVVRWTAISADEDATMRLRVSGTDAATNYDTALSGFTATGVSGSSAVSAGTSWYINTFDAGNSGAHYTTSIDVFGPAIAAVTTAGLVNAGMTIAGIMRGQAGGLRHNTATAYDGFSLIGTTMSGTVRVYGYKS